MRNSFQEQMVKLGLVDKKKVQKVKSEQYKAKKQKSRAEKGRLTTAEENALLIRKAAEKKKARDRQLNQEREAKLQNRSKLARIKQLVEQHRLETGGNGNPYRFCVSDKIYRVFVDKKMLEQLSEGKLGIVEKIGVAGQFAIVPRKIVTEIRMTDCKVFTSLADDFSPSTTETGEDDPYAEYRVPDDLVW